MNRQYLRQLLFSDSRQLLIKTEELPSFLMEAFPLTDASVPTPGSFLFFPNPPSYKELTDKALALLQQELKLSAEYCNVTLTSEFDSPELPDGSIAYHRIWGFITSDSKWFFSSKQMERDLLAAESNPAISCHFIHANSPGGEAWYLDRLSQTMEQLSKPVVTLVELLNCSACYYITCHSDYIATLTSHDTIGSIGTMVEAYNFDAYYKKLGIKIIREKSEKSDLKNKKHEDLRNGKPEQYIREVLNPLTEQFISSVRNARPVLNELPDDDPVFRGETFETEAAIKKGLIDGSMTFIEAVGKAVDLGKSYVEIENLKKSALNYV